jgi:hypothetical protein
MAKTSPKADRTAKSLKDEVVRMRIPAAQKDALVAAAEREGLDLSTWLRRIALREVGLLPMATAK